MSVKQTAPSGDSAMARHAASMVFPIGAPNDGFAQYFTGRSFLAPVSAEQVGIFNVTFEPGCRNNWHIHHAKSGGGQILICVAGRGFYQEWGRAAVRRAGGARRVRRKKHFSVCKPFGTKKSGPFPDLIFLSYVPRIRLRLLGDVAQGGEGHGVVGDDGKKC